jgi:thiamine-phosphate diphosphorylase
VNKSHEDISRSDRFPSIHIVTNDHVLADPRFLTKAIDVLDATGELGALHLRGRTIQAAHLYDLAATLCALSPTPEVFINDRVDIAAAVGASGAQLGARSLPVAQAREILGRGPAIGYSAHSAAEAAAAATDGANFILLGTIYRSASHPDQAPAGPELIAETAQRCALPLIAIGGITADKVREVQAAGASGVAVIGAIWNARDPVQAAREFAKLMTRETRRLEDF